jgi:hypothetical protein
METTAMPRLPRRAALLLPLAAACAPLPPREEAALPAPVRRPGGPEPTPEVIREAQIAFATPAAFAGNPAAAATALWKLEYLAAVMGLGGPDRNLDPSAAFPLRRGRAEARAAIGLRADVPPQRAVDALHAAAVALGAGNPTSARSALAPLLEPGREEAILDRLANLPPLPAAREGTEAAWVALQRATPPAHRSFDERRGGRF